MNKKITILPGDGIGPEVTAQSVKVLNAIAEKYGHQFTYEYHLIGADAIDKTGNPLPDETIESCLQSDAVLLGAVGHPKFDNDPSAKVRPEQGLLKIRKSLGLFANIRPVAVHKALAHLVPLKESHLEGVDMIIYRELTGGIYFGNKTTDGNIATDDCSYSREEITRIADLAFKQAMIRRKKLTLVDKANVLETSRLWRKVVQEMSAGYPEVAVDYMFVDNAAMQLIINPRQFDVMLTENMFGDILSDEASVLSGSLGLLPSASVGAKTALFEPIHGSYPQAAGKDIANPLGSILSIGMLMDHFGLHEEANTIRKAVDQSLATGIVTKDINAAEHYGTEAIGNAIAEYILGNEASFTEAANKEVGQSTVI